MLKNIKLLLSYPENRITAFIFMALAVAFGAFITRLPEIKDNLSLSEADLGTALFFFPLGAATLLPFYSKIISRFGERKTTSWALCALVLVMLLPGLAPNIYCLMASLYVVGLAMGLTDVAMNAEAAEIESTKSRVIMSSCHGFFSLGGMIGALLGSLFIALEVGLVLQMAIIGALLLIFIAPQFHSLIDSKKRVQSRGIQLPPVKVLIYAAIGLCVMMSEGGITDWSTILLRDDLSMVPEYAGFGFAGFSLLMALGRFNGDSLQRKFGGRPLLITGFLIGVIGLGLTLTGVPLIVILGFSLAGLGYSVVVPILYSESAKIDGVNPSSGIASVASAGYVGMLAGPVIIGFIAEEWGLPKGFTFLLALTTIGLLLSLKAFR